MTMADLAKKFNTVLSNISGKIKRNNFSEKKFGKFLLMIMI